MSNDIRELNMSELENVSGGETVTTVANATVMGYNFKVGASDTGQVYGQISHDSGGVRTSVIFPA
jgi:hypothetical protein